MFVGIFRSPVLSVYCENCEILSQKSWSGPASCPASCASGALRETIIYRIQTAVYAKIFGVLRRQPRVKH